MKENNKMEGTVIMSLKEYNKLIKNREGEEK